MNISVTPGSSNIFADLALPNADALLAFAGLTAGSYGMIVADPPWQFRTRSTKGEGRSAVQHYPVMKLDALMRLPVATLAASDSWLGLWVPGPHLPQGLRLIEAWGYIYSGIGWCWVKTNPRAPVLFWDARSFHTGLGFTTRKNVELCLLARRGHPKRVSKAVRELIIAPRREHSRKPTEFYDRVRAFARGPYLELFARELRPGFESWGNETTKFNT